MNELDQEEKMNALDPLRHLMHESLEDVLPAQPHSVQNESLELSFSSVHPPSKILIKLDVDASPGCGGIAWPAGEVLSAYLVRQGTQFIKGKSILELGSGTGLVGLVAAKIGGVRDIIITDQAPLLATMNKNVAINNLEADVLVRELNWGEAIPDLPMPDIILAADCVYFEPAFPLLVQTLCDLATVKTDVLFCYKKRRKADKRFFTLLKKEFTWIEIDDDPFRADYSRDSITLLRLVKLVKTRK